jgi:hypothetical protein
MWFVLIVIIIGGFVWLNQPKRNVIPIRNDIRFGVLPEDNLPAGGISRLLDS